MRCLRGLLLIGLTAGCSNAAAVREADLKHWIGRPETELAASFGAPNRIYNTGGMKFLTYEDRRVGILPGAPGGLGPAPFWYGGGGFPPMATTRVCDTTFTVAHGTVRAFSVRGNACG